MNFNVKKLFTLFALFAFLVISGLVYSETLPEASLLIKRVNDSDDGIQVTREVTMKMIDKSGKERIRQTISYRKYFGEDRKTVIFYTRPTNIKDTAFLRKIHLFSEPQLIFLER